MLRKDFSIPSFLPDRRIWKVKVALKVMVLVWSVAHKRTNRNDMVQKKRLMFCLSPQWCVMYKKSSELVDHRFLTLQWLWHLLFDWVGLCWLSPALVMVQKKRVIFCLSPPWCVYVQEE